MLHILPIFLHLCIFWHIILHILAVSSLLATTDLGIALYISSPTAGLCPIVQDSNLQHIVCALKGELTTN